MLLSPPRKKPSIGLTPLIDVVFILLIFFMLVMQFQQFQQNQINLQKQTKHGVNVTTSETVTVLNNELCEWQSTKQRCEDILPQLTKLRPKRVMVAYAPAATLQQVMFWHDSFVSADLPVSLAVSINEDIPTTVSNGDLP